MPPFTSSRGAVFLKAQYWPVISCLSIAAIDSHEVTGQYCELRNNAPLEEVQGGMGDIFIRLAKDN